MEIRLIFFKEIVGLISLKNEVDFGYATQLRSREEEPRRRFFLPNVTRSVLGDGASVTARDITVIKQDIDSVTGLDEKDRAILKRSADALEKLKPGNGD